MGQSGSPVSLVAGKKVGDTDILRGLHSLYAVKPFVEVPLGRVEKVGLVVKAGLDIVKPSSLMSGPQVSGSTQRLMAKQLSSTRYIFG